ncbi:hypothetical protein [Cryobacterium serini]|uniref:Uncharacterized protein n=1 Tax=Cryobacterium serini TaxID=1259201 RepID=A0A4R9BUQ8_9MICO|nr:hypothetical protein [Cryobacterium serini]TFD91419.1 hypothetical protein E3T51_01565 [Cryobacterium serini]
MENPEVTATEARRALEQLGADRGRAAVRITAPWWYQLIEGLLLAAFVLCFALDDAGFYIGASAIGFIYISLGLLRPVFTRTTAEPWSDARTWRAGLVQVAVILPIIVVSVLAHRQFDLLWILVATAAVVLVLKLALGARMERAFARSVVQGD